MAGVGNGPVLPPKILIGFTMNSMRWFLDIIQPTHANLYRFLQSCGVDGVKTDSQNSLDDIQEAQDRRTMIKAYQDAWTLQGMRHIQARQISCGSQVPVIMFHSMLSGTMPRVVVRNSDDFFPNIESSHAWHIFTNAHNALMMQHFNVLLDWDMFQTDHPWASYHAAARCISGGPVYITDYPDSHSKTLIDQMTAKTPRGNTVILRPQRLAKSSEAYNAYDEPKLLKIDTYHGMAQSGTAILGIFNVCQYTLPEVVSLSDFPGTETGNYIIRSYINSKTTAPMTQEDDHAFVHIELPVKGYDILTAYPISSFLTRKVPLKIANLGLLGKMSGAVAIIADNMYSDDKNRVRIWASLKALGKWGLWIDALPDISVEDTFFILLGGKAIPSHCVKLCTTDERVLEVDLEWAWKEGGYQAGWSNEVIVEVMIK
jgi:raffinose synthase Sip1-like protein